MTARVRAGLLLVVVFAAGAGAGGAAFTALKPGPPPFPSPSADDLEPPLSQLGLDASQRQRTRRILEQHRPELEAVLAEVMPRVRAIQDQVEVEIRRDVLDEAQRAKLDVLKRSSPPPPFPHGPPAPAQASPR